MNQNWKISTSSIKTIKSINPKKNIIRKKGVIIKYVRNTNPKYNFDYSPEVKSEVNLKVILDYIKMRIEFLKIEHACVYEHDTGSFVSACCICREKINKKNYVCTAISCISEFLKEINDDNTHLSGKRYNYDSKYDYERYDYERYDEGEAECYGDYPCTCAEKSGYTYGACNECGTCSCGSCIDVCRCYNHDDDNDYRGEF
jgi:hypothetical protein